MRCSTEIDDLFRQQRAVVVRLNSTFFPFSSPPSFGVFHGRAHDGKIEERLAPRKGDVEIGAMRGSLISISTDASAISLSRIFLARGLAILSAVS